MNQETSAGPSMVLAHHGTIAPGALVHDQTSTTCSFLAVRRISNHEHERLCRNMRMTYQVAVAKFPSEGAQTFWPWMIVDPHFLKTVPETEPLHACPPRAASSVMHLAASAVWIGLCQQRYQYRVCGMVTYVSSLPNAEIVVSAVYCTFFEDMSGDIRLGLKRGRCSCRERGNC